jgi:hypothetical protein
MIEKRPYIKSKKVIIHNTKKKKGNQIEKKDKLIVRTAYLYCLRGQIINMITAV